MQHKPEEPSSAFFAVALGACIGFFLFVAAYIAHGAFTVQRATIGTGAFDIWGVPMWMVGALAGGVGLALGGMMAAHHASQPLVPRVAKLVNQRARMNSAHSYVTVEFEDNSRTEFSVGPKNAGRFLKDDVGVAYVRGGVLLDFKRLV